MYNLYSSTASGNPGGVGANWQMTRSPPHQQQQQPTGTDQQRAYGGGQNVVQQAPPPTGTANAGGVAGRSTSTSGPSGQNSGGGPPLTPQYALNGNVQATYAYGHPGAWYSGPQQVASPQTNMPPQINAYGMMFDPSQQQQPQLQQGNYIHQNLYDPSYYQQQAAQQQPGL